MSQADRARARLVSDLLRDGRVRTPAVRDALASVPRHLFLPDLTPAEAYADEAVAIKVVDGATISSVSQPSMVAIMLEQLAAAPGHRVLEIGAGAGWNAGLLARIVGPSGAVTTVDIDDDLVRDTVRNLDAAGVPGVRAVTADGAAGHPPDAPYDRIELTVGSTDIRPEWVEQLVPGGRLLLPLAVRGSQLSVAFELTAPGRLDSVSVRSCAFIRLRGEGADAAPAAVALAGTGWAVQVAECGGPDPAVIGRALAGPGATADPSPEPGTVTDVWDGLGLWCALADTAVFRLLAIEEPATESDTGRAMFGSGPNRVAVGVAAGDGVAVLMAEPSGGIATFGPAGGVAAARLVGLVRGWVAAGRPHAADLRIRAEMPAPGPRPDDRHGDDRHGDDRHGDDRHGDDRHGDGVVVRTEHARLVLSWPPHAAEQTDARV
ncbi:protein-L-isoaspartate(D-aspartate) O-methyltransferase [Pseudonocardia sediminis]|uniref:Protein-L-isoaspartate O-methyltransferase n=1 Tax=Pseudonocardia sediminis TaxID=1397368 RepID=A0A4V2FR89_PSEST|nr:methyltransferase domain-containing protein [Pseudonocardia sediminis]RZT87700.1 protein-L-isoaspartate(D-aspartate) O-methyltransferase [Pseudonocardia sediminis]